ncbi:MULTISPECIES: phage tail tube protein [Cupriavidus]|uniref:phage tail tube protein n=1 Tax=Cupriavidus sp. 30B13 TaxID=3384241 RepID=UPI003B916347
MAKLNRKTVLLVKIETTPGTDAVPTGAANAILARSCTVQPLVAENVPRNLIRAYFGNSEQIPVGIHSELDCEVELAGAGAAGTAPAWGPLMRACGMSETVTAATDVKYAPVTGTNETVSIYAYIDGLLHKLVGCKGTVAFDITAKQIPVMRYKFIGTFAPVTDAGNPAGVDYSKFQRPAAVNKTNTATWSISGYTGPLQALQIDLANTLVWRSLVAYEGVEQTDRQPTGSINMELTTVASKDWWSTVRDVVLGALSITHGTVAGNIVKIDAPKVQMSNLAYADQDGVAMMTSNLTINPNVGNDELLITVK